MEDPRFPKKLLKSKDPSQNSAKRPSKLLATGLHRRSKPRSASRESRLSPKEAGEGVTPNQGTSPNCQMVYLLLRQKKNSAAESTSNITLQKMNSNSCEKRMHGANRTLCAKSLSWKCSGTLGEGFKGADILHESKEEGQKNKYVPLCTELG